MEKFLNQPKPVLIPQGNHVTTCGQKLIFVSFIRQNFYIFVANMSMSKVLESGLEAQILNGITRDNSKVNIFYHKYSLIHITCDFNKDIIMSSLFVASIVIRITFCVFYSLIHITRDIVMIVQPYACYMLSH